MHIPDGFIDGTTSAGAGVVAAGGLGAALRRAGQVLDERRVPLAGLVAAFIFAVQMLNFPVASGTSGHLLGGALAAVLVGPSVGAVCVSVVLLVQALLFADGGLSALGLNVLNMALVGAFAAYLLFVGLRRLLPARPGSVAVAAGVAAGLSVVVASVAFAIEYAIGGSGGVSVATVVGAMVGVHTLIGIGEGVITALVVSAVLATRPDLVWGARDLEPAASPSSSSGSGSGSEVPVAAGEVGS
jgi:cobalt/nickel transport system permease protein